MFNKRREISSEGIDICFYTVTDYRKNFSDEFQRHFLDNKGTSVSFTTDKGFDVKFVSLGHNLFCPLSKIIISDIKNGTILLECENGKGTVSNGNFGLDYQEHPYRNICIVRPFRIVLGKKVYIFANKAIDEMETLIYQLAEDIKTITPNKDVEPYLEKHKDTTDETGEESRKKDDNISSTIDTLQNLKIELLSLTETHDVNRIETNKHMNL